MAGAVMAITETVVGRMTKIKATWTSDDSSGAVSASGTLLHTGKVVLLTTIPAGGGAAPTDNYDIAITDADSVDVLAGGGQNRDTANTEQVLSTSLGAVVQSALTIAVTNAGNAKQGTIYVLIRA